ncbi:MAG: DegT/DnrJ/EryC1/StrS family aminotransferase, partial [Dysgonamonadaceae bacterium]|nr:DegT/DnrJ/EryC1/StrS family aminotransferase [Dysgonamonadaceae bacterium]
NSRLDELQAAFLNIKLKYLDTENQRRREIAKFYCDNIKNSEIILPINPDFFNSKQQTTNNKQRMTNSLSHVWHLFVIRTQNRNKLQEYLTQNGVQTLIHYPIPPHKQFAYKEWNDMYLPVTEKIHREVLSLPISSLLDSKVVEEICSSICNF